MITVSCLRFEGLLLNAGKAKLLHDPQGFIAATSNRFVFQMIMDHTMPFALIRGLMELFDARCMGSIRDAASAGLSLLPGIITARFDIKAVTDLSEICKLPYGFR